MEWLTVDMLTKAALAVALVFTLWKHFAYLDRQVDDRREERAAEDARSERVVTAIERVADGMHASNLNYERLAAHVADLDHICPMRGERRDG